VRTVVSKKASEKDPIDDRRELTQRINSLPDEQRELASESARFADLCSYLSQENVDLPPKIVEELGDLRRLDLRQRNLRMKALNNDLMKYLSDLGLGSKTPQ
jgi:hypothetical protein